MANHPDDVWLFDVDGTLIGSIRSDWLRPGALELIELLKTSDTTLVAWSAGGAEYARRMLAQFDMARVFIAFYHKDQRGADGNRAALLPRCYTEGVEQERDATGGAGVLPIVHMFYEDTDVADLLPESGAKAIAVPDRGRNFDYLNRLSQFPELPRLQHSIDIGTHRYGSVPIFQCTFARRTAMFGPAARPNPGKSELPWPKRCACRSGCMPVLVSSTLPS